MNVIVEMNYSTDGHLGVMRITMSRVPLAHEIIRVRRSVNGLTTVFCFRVARVVHNANTDTYPKRAHEIDAWVDCVEVNCEGG